MASEPTSWAKAALSKIDFTWPENGHASLDAAYLPVISRLVEALTEINRLSRCQCDKPWTDRNMHAPDCPIDARVEAEDALASISPADLAAVEKWSSEHKEPTNG